MGTLSHFWAEVVRARYGSKIRPGTVLVSLEQRKRVEEGNTFVVVVCCSMEERSQVDSNKAAIMLALKIRKDSCRVGKFTFRMRLVIVGYRCKRRNFEKKVGISELYEASSADCDDDQERSRIPFLSTPDRHVLFCSFSLHNPNHDSKPLQVTVFSPPQVRLSHPNPARILSNNPPQTFKTSNLKSR